MNNCVTRFRNELYTARKEMFGEDNAKRWLKERRHYYERLEKLADIKGFKNYKDLCKWRDENREEYERFMK